MSNDTTILKLRSGQLVELPRRKIGELKDSRGRTRPQVITDFSGIMGCQRCDGIAGRDGRLDSMGGMLWVVQIDAHNQWHPTIAACNCVFGAWRHARGLAYADDMAHIPPGLSVGDWRVLAVYGKSGMSWEQILQELPEAEEYKIGPRIKRWLEDDPPAYDPNFLGPRRLSEQDPALEGQPPESSLPAYELDMTREGLSARETPRPGKDRGISGQAEVPF